MPDTARAAVPATRPAVDVQAATAGASLADLVAGPTRPARVLSAFPSAVYLQPEGGRVVALVTSDGIALPNALVLDRPAAARPFDAVAPGQAATVGSGDVRIGPLAVRVDLWVDRRYRPVRVDGATLVERLDAFDDLLDDVSPLPEPLVARLERLVAALSAADAGDSSAAATGLLGLGEGLTPSGDDLISGLAAGGRAFAPALGVPAVGRLLHDVVGGLLAVAAVRTTALSASLLWHAARGEPAAPARHVLRALAGETPLAPAATALLRVGHRSGSDLAHGLAAGTRLVLAAFGDAPRSEAP